jgi:ATP-dependent Clp protease protease subunit
MRLLLFILLFSSTAYSADITLTTTNVCVLNESVSKTSMYKMRKCIDKLVARRRGRNVPIYLYVNSPGGSVYDGIRFINYAKNVRNLHTITEFAASMAAAIVQGIPGKRYVMEHGTFMFHRAKGRFSGQFEDGEVEQRLKLWKKIVRGMEQMQANRIGITLKEYKKRRLNEWWVYGDDNISSNTADHIVTVVCSKKLASIKRVVTKRSFFGSYKKELSACPLVN